MCPPSRKRLNGLAGLWLALVPLLAWGQAEDLLVSSSDRISPTGKRYTELMARIDPAMLRFQPAPEGGCRATADIRLDARDKNGMRVYAAELVRAFRFEATRATPAPCATTRRGLYFRKRLPLPPGAYSLSMDLRPRGGGSRHLRQWEHTVESQLPDFHLSDVQLGRGDSLVPGLLARELKPQRSLLPFRLEVFNRRPRAVRYRAILYRKNPRQPLSFVQQFQSALQHRDAMNLRPGYHEYRDSFQLAGLRSGQYLLEVFLFQGDSVLAERSLGFYRVWEGLARVKENVPASIRQLRLMTSPGQVAQMLGAPGPQARRESLMTFWQDWAATRNTSPQLAMTQYYQQIYAANERFGAEEARPGWSSDRGRLFIQLGEPTRVDSLQHQGKAYRRWYYRRLDLRVLFERRRDGFVGLSAPS